MTSLIAGGLSQSPLASLLTVLAALVTIGLAVWIYLGLVVVSMMGGVAVVALVVWLRTTWLEPLDHRQVFVPYMAVMASLLALHTEQIALEYAEAFAGLFPNAFERPVIFNEYSFVISFPLFWMALGVFGALGLLYKNRMSGFLVWFIPLWAIVCGLSAYWPIAFSSYGFSYFPGMASGWLPVMAGAAAIRLSLHRLKTPADKKEE